MTRQFKFGALLVTGFAAVAGFAMLTQTSASRSWGGVPGRVGTPKDGRVEKTDAEWRAVLSDEAYRVTRRKGTERAFSGQCWDTTKAGEYACICCGQILFDSADKFDSGTGWPSYGEPIDVEALTLREESGLFDDRTEVTCSRCDAHLGHVFNDGPPPTGRRYCMNSAAMTFTPAKQP